MRSDRPWMIPAGLLALGLVPALAGTSRLAQLASGTPTPETARFFAAPAPVSLHIVAGVLFSLLGAFQFSATIRRRHRRFHRASGRLLLPAALVVAVTGLWMTLTYPWPAMDGVAVYAERLVFGVAMLAAVGLGADALRRRRYVEHGAWMTRAYAIGMGAGTQVLTHLPWFLLADQPPDGTPRAVMMGLGWVINIAVAEWVLRRPSGSPAPVAVVAR